jgi:hypothetical protein
MRRYIELLITAIVGGLVAWISGAALGEVIHRLAGW